MALFYNAFAWGKSQGPFSLKGSELKPSGAPFSRFFFLCLFLSLVLVPAAWGDFTHLVRKGESLSTLAQKYGLSITRIQEANDLEGTKIQIGQRLIIPQQPVRVRSSPDRNESRKPEDCRIADPAPVIPDTHLVKKGETLVQIARRYNLSVKDLQEINGLKGSKLKIGQALRVKREGEDEGLEVDSKELEREEFVAQAEIPKPQMLEGDGPPADKDNDNLVQVAQNFLGVKYRRGGTSLVHGLDCSAFVQKVFRVVGVDLPRTAREQFEMGLGVARDALRLGDLVFFKPHKARRPTHVGIYIGNGQFIHTSLTKRKVNIDSLNTRYFSTRFMGGRRIEDANKQPEIKTPLMEYPNSLEANFEPTAALRVPHPPIN